MIQAKKSSPNRSWRITTYSEKLEIAYKKHSLANGLEIILHDDRDLSPIIE
jgi:hypothetical protein